MYKFGPTIYDTIIDNSELWFCDEWGNAMMIDHCAFMDC